MFLNSFGDTFETQKSLEEKSLKHTVQHFSSSQDYKELSQLMFDHWIKPPIFEDSISSDIKGATALGIRALWLNRFGNSIPDGVVSISNLLEVIQGK